MIDAYLILWRWPARRLGPALRALMARAGIPPATQTTITGLTNGTEYEFAVTASAIDGAIGPQGSLRPHRSPRAQLLIRKSTAPAGGTGFTFTQDIDNSGNFTLDEPGYQTLLQRAPWHLHGYRNRSQRFGL